MELETGIQRAIRYAVARPKAYMAGLSLGDIFKRISEKKTRRLILTRDQFLETQWTVKRRHQGLTVSTHIISITFRTNLQPLIMSVLLEMIHGGALLILYVGLTLGTLWRRNRGSTGRKDQQMSYKKDPSLS